MQDHQHLNCLHNDMPIGQREDSSAADEDAIMLSKSVFENPNLCASTMDQEMEQQERLFPDAVETGLLQR